MPFGRIALGAALVLFAAPVWGAPDRMPVEPLEGAIAEAVPAAPGKSDPAAADADKADAGKADAGGPAAGKPSAPASPGINPVWWEDRSRLEDDLAAINGCFIASDQHNNGEEGHCARAVHAVCRADQGEETSETTLGLRQCNWRAIAAWEQVLDETIARLEPLLLIHEKAPFARAQAAWIGHRDANTAFYWAQFEGGSLAPVAAGDARATMTALRAIELRSLVRDRVKR